MSCILTDVRVLLRSMWHYHVNEGGRVWLVFRRCELSVNEWNLVHHSTSSSSHVRVRTRALSLSSLTVLCALLSLVRVLSPAIVYCCHSAHSVSLLPRDASTVCPVPVLSGRLSVGERRRNGWNMIFRCLIARLSSILVYTSRCNAYSVAVALAGAFNAMRYETFEIFMHYLAVSRKQ